MSILGAIKNAGDEIKDAVDDIVKRPSKKSSSNGQLPPGTMTSNVGNQKLKEFNVTQSHKSVINNNLGVVDSDNKPSSQNIGTNLGQQFIQPNNITNIANNDMNNFNIKQSSLGSLTNNIGNNDIDLDDIKQTNKTNNIGNDLGEQFVNTSVEKNNDIDLNDIKQSGLGNLTNNIGNKEIDLNDIKQNNNHNNIGNNLGDQFINTEFVRNNEDLKNKLFENVDKKKDLNLKENDIQNTDKSTKNNTLNDYVVDTKSNISTTQPLNEILYQEPEVKEKNTIELKENSIVQSSLGNITNNVNNQILKESIIENKNINRDLNDIKNPLYDNNIQHKNIGNLNDISLEHKDIKHTLNDEILYEQQKKTTNISNESLKEELYNNQSITKKNDLDTIYDENKKTTTNIGQNLGENDIEIKPKEIFKGETLYKYNDETQKKVNLNQLFDNPSKNDKNIKNQIGDLYTEKGDVQNDDLSVIVKDTFIETLFDNTSNVDNIPKDQVNIVNNTNKVNNIPKDQVILYDNSPNKRKVELDEITSKMSNRKNIGTNLGMI